ncbi:DUF3021 family protein [Fructobacillus fructosus]|uniref:DUF3021 family protein n=1 Tax=Fructobacillus fructosus TaxID=1631 RepID=UPI001658AD81|nr:DUF3021 family protein [Fructobacillus fructosus]MBD9367043.1 DUF3021 family protein [Leuconostoc mesenteroides]
MGLLCFATNFIFSTEKWSFTKQTIYHFFTTYMGYTSLVVFEDWCPLNLNMDDVLHVTLLANLFNYGFNYITFVS